MKVEIKSLQEHLNEGFEFDATGNLINRKVNPPEYIAASFLRFLGKKIKAEKVDGIRHFKFNDQIHSIKNPYTFGKYCFDEKHIKKIIPETTLLTLIERREIYEKAYEKYGESNQFLKALEELAELGVEVAKYANSTIESGDAKIIDEISDVEVQLEQIKMKLNITKDVEERKDYKVRRLKQRMGID